MAGLLTKFLRVQAIQGEVVSGAINGTNTTFTLANPPLSNNFIFILSVDGVINDPGTDYTLSNQTITMTSAPKAGQVLKAYYMKST